MPDAIYIETTIPSYYVSRPSRNVVQLARQQLTREWWDFRRGAYDLFTSQVVLEEAADGDSTMAQDRLNLLAGIPLLDINDEVWPIWQMNLSRAAFCPLLRLGMRFTLLHLPSTGCNSFSLGTAGTSQIPIFANGSEVAFRGIPSIFQ